MKTAKKVKKSSVQHSRSDINLLEITPFPIMPKSKPRGYVYDRYYGAKMDWGIPNTVNRTMRISCHDVYDSTYGPHKTMSVWFFNEHERFAPVAVFSTCRESAAHRFVKELFFNTPIYRPKDGFDNYFYPGHNVKGDPIFVRTDMPRHIVQVGLNKNFKINLPFQNVPEWEHLGDLTFILGGCGFEFFGRIDETGQLIVDPSVPYPNGYTGNNSYYCKTASVRPLYMQYIAEPLPPAMIPTPPAMFTNSIVMVDGFREFVPP